MTDRLLLLFELEKTWPNRSFARSFSRKNKAKKGRKAWPTAGMIDAQSVKSTLVSSESKGFNAGKKVKGVKRHIVTDTLGLVLAVVIQSASV